MAPAALKGRRAGDEDDSSRWALNAHQTTKVADHLRGPSAFDSCPISALIAAEFRSKKDSRHF